MAHDRSAAGKVRGFVARDRVIPVFERTCVMGILNVTPDSFSDGGEYLDPDDAVRRALVMAEHGADIIDIGGESSRPGGRSVDEDEELRRVIPVIRELAERTEVPLSVDTRKSSVARRALEEGACIINDITGLRGDEAMAGVIAEFDAGAVIMHMKGTPRDMQLKAVYEDVTEEILEYLKRSAAIAEEAGIGFQGIMVDPGIGFGKTVKHNFQLIRDLGRFRQLGHPVLIGTSRKSFIGRITGCGGDRLMGTAASCAVSIINGANVIRVHDVKEMKQVALIADRLKRDRTW